MEKHWTNEAIFYHIYPLGFCGAPKYAHDETECQHRIKELIDWIPHLVEMKVNAVYLGPVFASYEHGYDTSDYRMIDKRLGTNEDFIAVCDALHEAGIRIVLDGVFNHVGRAFWAFKDVQEKRESSPYKDWFHNINFHNRSPYDDPFSYEAWEGHYNLVKLNLRNEETVRYLLDSVGMWMDSFHIDGLRLDAADCIDKQFFARLKEYTKQRKADFWLMGEIIHGDYSLWANPDLLDSVTNYECYKGLYSAHNTKNYFEIAYSLNRQFGSGGIYKNLNLYNFTDNHDVNRLASMLSNSGDLKNVYTLLYTMPGVPSIYYGSEYGIEGKKQNGSDDPLRPELSLTEFPQDHPLYAHICQLGALKSTYLPLQYGTYEQVTVKNQQFIFKRTYQEEAVYTALNLADEPCSLVIPTISKAYDVFKEELITEENGTISITLPPHESCILYVGNHIPNKQAEAKKKPVKQAESERSDKKEHKKQTKPAQKKAKPHSDDKKKNPIIQLKTGVYRHYKGNEYAVLYIAKHSETTEAMVVYRQLYGDAQVWVRPLSIFIETVMVDGNEVPRFTYLHK